MTNKFTEEFPELKDKIIHHPAVHSSNINPYDLAKVLIKDIQKHCQSNSKVREAIEKYVPLINSEQEWINKEKLLKELNLEVK